MKRACTIVIFGATGDLARRKLLPALAVLRHHGFTDDSTIVLGVARDTKMTDEAYRGVVADARSRAGAGVAGDDRRRWIERCVFYEGTGEGKLDDFRRLGARLQELERRHDGAQEGNRVFYLAIPPAAFEATIDGIQDARLHKGGGWSRVVIEKPFGRDLPTAQELNRLLHRCFDDPGVTAVVIDPLASTTRAHRFYERLVFQPVERRMFGDDDCLVLRLERARWQQSSAASG